jgi:hypothetical protein
MEILDIPAEPVICGNCGSIDHFKVRRHFYYGVTGQMLNDAWLECCGCGMKRDLVPTGNA